MGWEHTRDQRGMAAGKVAAGVALRLPSKAGRAPALDIRSGAPNGYVHLEKPCSAVERLPRSTLTPRCPRRRGCR